MSARGGREGVEGGVGPETEGDASAVVLDLSAVARADLPAKLYFRIGEVAELVGVEPHVLRYWEREFRSIRPTKSAKGQRVYSRRDVESLLRVRELLYREGFTIAGAKKKLQRSGQEPRESREAPELAEPESPTADRPSALSAERDGAPVDVPGVSPPASAKIREQLTAMREEIEAFLAELGSPRR
jgi:DNA-binding transcriptional MerR regulator